MEVFLHVNKRNKGLFSTNWMKSWNIKGLAKELYIVIYNYEIPMHQSLVPKVVPSHCIVKTMH